MSLLLHGIVLKRIPLPAGDKRLTLLTRERGIAEIYARHTGNKKSRYAASFEALAYSEFTVFEGRNNLYVESADLLENFFPLRENLTAFTLAAYFCELCRYVLPTEDNAPECLQLLLNMLSMLSQKKRSEAFLRAVFELRLLALSGFSPDFSGCMVCGEPLTENAYFFPLEGIVCCERCLSETEQKNGLFLPRPAFLGMLYVLTAPAKKICSFTLNEKSEAVFCRAVSAFCRCHADGHFPSLSLYETLSS